MKSIKEITGALILSIVFLTSCRGGGIETNFIIEKGGVEKWDTYPKIYADKVFETEIQYVNQTKFHLIASRGNILIDGDLDAESIIVEAELLVGSDTLEDAKEHLASLEVQVIDQSDEILIQTIEPEITYKREYIIDYHIILPSDLEVEITQDNGDITVENLDNLVIIDQENGSISLNDIFGNVDLALSNGSIYCSATLPLDGEIRMVVDNGKLDLRVPVSTSAEVEASTFNGSVSTSNLEFINLDKTPESITGILDQGDGIINLIATNGNISIVGVDE